MEEGNNNNELPCPSPSPFRSSSLFKDISNFKTPKRASSSSSFLSQQHTPQTQFFTASKSKHTTTLPRRPRLKENHTISTASKKLKAFQLEQSHSSRIEQIKQQQSLKSLAKSLTVWLNFLLESPASCGCDVSIAGGSQIADASPVTSKGKRDNVPGNSFGVDSTWRTPKRQRKTTMTTSSSRFGKENVSAVDMQNSSFSRLKDSLKDVCSFDDFKQRMSVYLSLGTCEDIFHVMNQVTKTIDEGRLNMKAHCPIVTDLGLKDKAIKVLMCYNPSWLRIGLYIIFGGDSLVSNGDGDSDKDVTFLKMVIDKLFFTHEGFAKSYAYNKMVEGVYRSGYYENLGNVILKRILLLVLILDKAKCQSCLPIEYGIDGLDSGSPLLFKAESWVKASSQVIQEFLSSDVMRGEGNLLTHLVILGYKLTHQQGPLVEYDFRVKDLFIDLQDGLKLCRAIHLLQNDSSILKKIAVPSDTRKKNMVNSGVALQYLRLAGVSLLDEDGTMIVADDIVNGDRELTISLLWNMFIHLQLPLLVDKTSLVGEISKIRGLGTELMTGANSSSLELLLKWIQAVCDHYNCPVDNFHSLVDGKAIWCLLDHYFQKELHNVCSLKEFYEKSGKTSIMSVNEYSDALYNFILSQKLTTLLGNFPEVLQISELLQYNGACSDRSVVILVVFLASQLFVKEKVDNLNFHKLLGYDCQNTNRRNLRTVQCHSRSESAQKPYDSDVGDNEDTARKFKAIQTWWQDMADRNCIMQPTISILQTSMTTECNTSVRRENAARTIQSRIRGLVVHRKFHKMVNSVTLLQTVFRAWLKVRQESVCIIFTTGPIYDFSCEILKKSEVYEKYVMLFYQRHSFLRLKRSAQLIQQAVRSWFYWRARQGCRSPDLLTADTVNAATSIQKFLRGWMARSRYIYLLDQKEKTLHLAEQKLIFDLKTKAAIGIQVAWKNYIRCKSTRKEHLFATKIQCNFRRWLLRKRFINQIQAVIKIQSYFRMWRCVIAIQNFKTMSKAAIVIQSFFRGWIARKNACARKNQIVEIQRHCRGWLVKRNFLFQRDAIVKIQSVSRSLKCQKTLNCQKDAALEIQRFIRGHLTRNRLLGSALRLLSADTGSCISRPAGLCSFQLEAFMFAVVKLQRWWRGLLLLKLMTRSAIIIQSCTRGWIARRKAIVETQNINVMEEYAALELQRYIRGHLTRNLILGSASKLRAVAAGCISKRTGFCSFQLELFLFQVVKLQRWWKHLLLHKLMTKSAIIIQSHIRGWAARRKAVVYRHHIVVIQSHWKGYVARQQSTKQLMDLRSRLQESSKNVDDSKRLINRLLAALSELLSMKSLSDILHTCSTLDLATWHSQRCCEELVAAGAIDTLLRLIRLISRSIPDQEVLKHVLSTLRNLARYPHLLEVLIQRQGSIQTIVLELLRNKEEGFFIASELLKKICSTQKGVETILKSPAFLKRLHSLVEELTRKATYQKRNVRGPTPSSIVIVRENTDRRLKEVTEILKLLAHP
ncbi:putative abnormal spindle-like microcephaly-associated protein [Medicago truncatula]|uniref:Abnormal spindle-like microcephaly-associated-like protein, putative n=1 Tax=Medicago truncatula TaxID=3880 RepID=G7JI24_MEDTR|nr:abnormal spindle-like microcephaly-associated protein homolog isoform X2 [Medicago truncatula]AES92611.2 abnormal spindle-like microcephaly-associated-like protein, putative [Medicago truncatula]RHN64956.1 putative abnormal spindle-like microcephaly-associated protein [Medicago truncatula]